MTLENKCCDHDIIVEIGRTDELTTQMLHGIVHYYLNCLICRTTLLRDEQFYHGYRYTGVEVNNQPLYHRKDFTNGGK